MGKKLSLHYLLLIAAGVTLFCSGCSLLTSIQPTPTGTINSTTAQKVTQLYRLGKGVINTFSLSPDNKQVGVITSTGVDLYDTNTWQSRSLFGSSHFNVGIISPDWSLIALADSTGVTVYHVSNQTRLVQFTIQQGMVSQLQFTPDNQYLLVITSVPTGDTYYNQVETHKLPDGGLISTWNAGTGINTALSSDGKTIFAWNGSALQGVRRVVIPGGSTLPAYPALIPNALAVSPDGMTLAIFDGKIEMVDPATGAILHSLPNSPQDVIWLGYSPDGKWLVSISSEQIAQIWQMPEGKLVRTYPVNHDYYVKAVFSKDGSNLAIETLQGLEIRRVADGELERSLDGYSAGITLVGFNPDNSSIVAAVGNSSRLPDLVAWKLFSQTALFQLNKTQISALAYSTDGKLLVAGLSDGSEQLIDAQTGRVLKTLKEHANVVQGLAFSPDNTLVASSAFDIRWWRASDGKLLQDVSFPIGMGMSVSQVVFSPDGSQIAAFSDGFVGLWRVSDGTLMGTFQVNSQIQFGFIGFVPKTNTLAVAFKSDNEAIGPNNQPAALEFWDPIHQKIIRTIALANSQLSCMAISLDGSLLAFGMEDGTIQLRKVDDGSLLSTLPGHAASVSGLDFSRDGRYLLSGSWDGTIRLWGMAVK